MTRRFDLTGSGSAAVNPNFGSLWVATGAAVRRPLPASRTTSTQTANTATETSTTNALDTAVFQWVSDDTFATGGSCAPGNFDTLLLCMESASGMNAFLQVVIRVTSGDGLTERGVLYSGQTATSASSTTSDPNAEFSTTFERVRRLTAACTPVTVQAGDRLVVEMGFRACNTSSTSFTGTLKPGSTSGTDITTAQIDGTTTNRPWIEFTNDPFAVTPAVTADLTGSGAFSSTVVAVAVVAAALAGSGAFSADVVPVMTTTADLTGSGAFTATSQAAGAVTADLTGSGAFSATSLPVFADAADLTGSGAFSATSFATFDRTADLTGSGAFTATVEAFGAVPEINAFLTGSGAFSSSIEVNPLTHTDTTNRVGGLQFSGYMVLDWTPAVVDPPAALAPAHDYEVARAHSVPVLTEGRQPAFTVTEKRQVRARDRVIVGGKDITFWRDVHTPTPDYSLVDPLRYGAGSLPLPQVHALYELDEMTPGGSLSFLAQGKPVIVQRVDPETGDVVAADDYRGIIMDYDIDGDDLTLVLGGEVTGRMAVRWLPTPAFKSLKDVGRMVFRAFRRTVPARFTPRLGPVTGIKLNTFGGQWEIDHLSEVLAKAVQVDGDQWTVGRRDDGTWGMWLKDRETIHATIYFDDSAMKFSAKQSVSESPNRVFVTAVAKDGRRINFRVYPGLKQGEAPPYPTTGPFGEGTTNEDLDHPEDAPITAMVHRLVVMGYLSVEDNTDYSYDADVTAAIKRLQDDAGLTESGDMNTATWAALYDLDATGYSLAGAETLPAAQLSKTRMWNRTASGALSTRNPNYDPHLLKVDLPLSMGSVRSRQKAREFAKAKVQAGGDWIGSVECHLALIEGEHTPGDPIDTIMSPRAVRPGMNIWAPLWDGGTLFHVSGADVSDQGDLVKLALDTRARPTMEAWEAIQRNAESRKHPTRLWINEHRGVMLDKDGGEWDDIAGLIDDRVRLRGGHWTQFPVVAGQEGIVRSLRSRLAPAERYAIAIFGQRIGPRDGTSPWLDRLVPAPLSDGGSERWDDPVVRRKLDDRILLYTAGQHDQALGYFPGRETNDAGEATGNPVNGRWEDDAGFPYRTFREPVLYVAIWVPDDTSLRAGRLMWDQFNNTGD